MTNCLINWYGRNVGLIGVINHDKRLPVSIPPNDYYYFCHILPYFGLRHCHVLAALSCYPLSLRDSTFVNWTAIQHLHDRCGLRDRTCVGPRRVSGLPGPVRGEW